MSKFSELTASIQLAIVVVLAVVLSGTAYWFVYKEMDASNRALRSCRSTRPAGTSGSSRLPSGGSSTSRASPSRPGSSATSSAAHSPSAVSGTSAPAPTSPPRCRARSTTPGSSRIGIRPTLLRARRRCAQPRSGPSTGAGSARTTVSFAPHSTAPRRVSRRRHGLTCSPPPSSRGG